MEVENNFDCISYNLFICVNIKMAVSDVLNLPQAIIKITTYIRKNGQPTF